MQDQSSTVNPKGQGKMDYRFTAVFERGAGMKALGFYELTAKAGVHWNNFFHDKEPFKLDSDDDQNSIHLGFK